MAAEGTSSQGSRSLARLGFGSCGAPQKALMLLFQKKPTPFTSFNSFPSYPILNPASWTENSKNRPGGTFIEGARPLARVGFGGAHVSGSFSLLFPMLTTPSTFFKLFSSYSTFHWLFEWTITG